MQATPKRGSTEHCLARGEYAEMLLRRFKQIVTQDQMVFVQYWFEELHRKAEFFLNSGHELVNLGVQRRDNWDVCPFMLFNPTQWIGHRRILVGATEFFNPCVWVSIEPHSVTVKGDPLSLTPCTEENVQLQLVA